MIKGTNRRMFRRPRPAREASGILASSQELINQVLPLRMQSGGDPFAKLKALIERQSASIEEPGFLDLLQSLGVGALQSEAVDPSRSTLQNLARALPFALESLDKKELAADQRALALAQASGQLTQMEKELEIAQNEALRKNQKQKIDEFNARLTNKTKEALVQAGVGFSPTTNSLIFGGKVTSISELQNPEISPLSPEARKTLNSALRNDTEALQFLEILKDPAADRGQKLDIIFNNASELSDPRQRKKYVEQQFRRINRQGFNNKFNTIMQNFGVEDKRSVTPFFLQEPGKHPRPESYLGTVAVQQKTEDANGNTITKYLFKDVEQNPDGSLRFTDNELFTNRFKNDFITDGKKFKAFTKELLDSNFFTK